MKSNSTLSSRQLKPFDPESIRNAALAAMLAETTEETDGDSFTFSELMQADQLKRTRMQWRTIVEKKIKSGEWIKTKKRHAKCGVITSFKKAK